MKNGGRHISNYDFKGGDLGDPNEAKRVAKKKEGRKVNFIQ